MARKKKGTVFVVDSGTETTQVARKTNDVHVEVIPDPDGNPSTPTAFGFEDGDPEKPLYAGRQKATGDCTRNTSV